MNTKHKVINLVILDESGSMHAIKKATISGFNELIQSIRNAGKEFPEQEHLFSLISFNGNGIKTLHWNEPVSGIHKINSFRYNPDSSTPLFDAMGFGISRQMHDLKGTSDYNVLVTVLTDGEENSSREYNGSTIKKMIDDLSSENWTFTYMGANHDVVETALKISIKNTIRFESNDADVKRMFDKEKESRLQYMQKIRDKEDFKKDYFKFDE